FGKHGSFKEYEQTAKLSSYGLATDAIADVLQKDRRTIEQWQKAIGQKGQQFHLFLCFTIELTILFLVVPTKQCRFGNTALSCFVNT
ncbi:MAG: hypothetical protein JRE64_17075, partial [Deltaproteobacteria bacterium]|nr:hypothetical protein [Deltaproteobacteria bacterium]